MNSHHSVFFRCVIRSAALFVMLIGLAVCDLSAQDLLIANSIYNRGLEHYADGDYPGAVDYLAQIVEMMPDHDQARYYLAYCYSLSGKHDQAIEQARVLAERYPGHQVYLQLIAEFSQKKLETVQLSRPSQPSQPAHETTLSEASHGYTVYTPALSKPREMRRETAVSKVKTPIEQIAEQIEEERYVEASEALVRLLAAEPENAVAQYYMGVLHFNQGEFAAAAGHFEASLKNRPENFDSSFFAGSCYLNRQVLDKAEKHFEQALKIKDDAFASINLADIYVRTGRPTESEKMYEKIIKGNPEYTEARIGLALVKLAQGLVEESAELVNKVLSESPANTRARFARSQILMENRLYSEALAEAKAACDGAPGNPEYRVNYALALLRNFQVESGMLEAQDVLDVCPEFVEARMVLAEGLIMTGDTAAAAGHIDAAAARWHIPQIDYLRATLAATNKDNEQARSHWKKYLEASVGLPSAHVKYAQFLESIADNQAALKAYQNISEKFPDTTLAAGVQADIERLSLPTPLAEVAPRPPIPGL